VLAPFSLGSLPRTAARRRRRPRRPPLPFRRAHVGKIRADVGRTELEAAIARLMALKPG